MARRARALGLELVIDLHYSDRWADPGRQDKPQAWATHSFAQLKQDVHDHTFLVCQALVASGAVLKIVQVGNEIDNGLLWPEGKASASLDRTAELVAVGAAAVKAASPSTLVMLHLAGGDPKATRWLLDGLSARGVRWDVTGLSHYSDRRRGPPALARDLVELADRYGKPVIVAETGYPFTLDDRPRACATFCALCAPCPAGADGASSIGREPGRPSPAMAGIRRTRRPAMRGRTRRCSTLTADRSPRSTSSGPERRRMTWRPRKRSIAVR